MKHNSSYSIASYSQLLMSCTILKSLISTQMIHTLNTNTNIFLQLRLSSFPSRKLDLTHAVKGKRRSQVKHAIIICMNRLICIQFVIHALLFQLRIGHDLHQFCTSVQKLSRSIYFIVIKCSSR